MDAADHVDRCVFSFQAQTLTVHGRPVLTLEQHPNVGINGVYPIDQGPVDDGSVAGLSISKRSSCLLTVTGFEWDRMGQTTNP